MDIVKSILGDLFNFNRYSIYFSIAKHQMERRTKEMLINCFKELLEKNGIEYSLTPRKFSHIYDFHITQYHHFDLKNILPSIDSDLTNDTIAIVLIFNGVDSELNFPIEFPENHCYIYWSPAGGFYKSIKPPYERSKR